MGAGAKDHEKEIPFKMIFREKILGLLSERSLNNITLEHTEFKGKNMYHGDVSSNSLPAELRKECSLISLKNYVRALPFCNIVERSAATLCSTGCTL